MLPIGQAILFTERQLEQESQIDEAAIAMAIALWRKYAPPSFRALITGGGALYGWDAERRVFFYESNRRPIDPLRLRNAAVEPFLNNVRLLMREVSKRLQDRTITIPEWQTEMISLVKYSQLAVALVANGGAENTDDADTALISLGILAMLAFLAGFARDIQTGKQPLNGLLLSRTDLYSNGARDAYEEARRNGFIRDGSMVEERRVLDPEANHCHTDETGWEGCPELAARGWQPIGSLPRLYDTPCRTNCRCHFQFR